MAPITSKLILTLKTTNLPTLPHILLQVLDMCGRDEASLPVIADIIGMDAALSAKVIDASNGAQFGRQNNFASLEQRLSQLGLDMVQTIVISASVYEVFNSLCNTPGFDLKVFWRRSLTSAFLAKLIAQKISYPQPEEAYLTGLLLDIGQLVLWSNFPKQYVALLVDKVDDIQFMARESETIGNNHCEVGAWLVSNWNLKSFMADAVLYHHKPQDKIADAHQLIQIAHVANSLATAGADDIEILSAGWQLLEITPVGLRQIVEDAEKFVSKVAQSLEVKIDTTHPGAGSGHLQEEAESDELGQKRMQLAMELRDITLIGRNPLGTGAATTLDNALLSIQRSAQILFGFKNVIFFLPDQQGSILKGKNLSGQGELVNEMSIPLNKGNSIVTDAFLTRVPNSTFTTGDITMPSILDEQIIRLMQTEVLYCQPMVSQNVAAGVMIFGLLQTQFAQVEKQKKLVSMFAQQSAQAIAALNAFSEQEERIKNEITASIQTQAQKVMHEVNNPLGIIKNYIKLLGVRLPSDDSVQEDLGIIKEEIDRVTRVIRTVGITTGAEVSLKEELNVNDVIQNLCKILVEAFFSQHQVVVQMQFDPALPNIVTDKDKLIQVMINLMKNAAEAMQNGGTLLISTRANVMHNGSEYIEIFLKDNGPGIPAKIMENLFEPVTSSKGSGLGLSIVKNIVEELGGKIFCQSNGVSGTAFQILLPGMPAMKHAQFTAGRE